MTTPAGPDPLDGLGRIKGAFAIPLGKLVPDPNQPRQEFDEDALRRLAASLRDRGQLQPIRVRWDEGRGAYVVVLGERRYRAAKIAGLETVACVVAEGNPSPQELLEDQLVENCLREDLKPTDQARAFRSLMRRADITQAELAARLNLSPGTVNRSLSLLDLPEPVKAAVDAGRVSQSVAYEVSKLADPAQQVALAESAAAGKASLEDVRRLTTRAPRPRKPRPFSHAAGAFTVTVAGDPSPSPSEVVAALESALKAARKAAKEGMGVDAA